MASSWYGLPGRPAAWYPHGNRFDLITYHQGHPQENPMLAPQLLKAWLAKNAGS